MGSLTCYILFSVTLKAVPMNRMFIIDAAATLVQSIHSIDKFNPVTIPAIEER